MWPVMLGAAGGEDKAGVSFSIAHRYKAGTFQEIN